MKDCVTIVVLHVHANAWSHMAWSKKKGINGQKKGKKKEILYLEHCTGHWLSQQDRPCLMYLAFGSCHCISCILMTRYSNIHDRGFFRFRLVKRNLHPPKVVWLLLFLKIHKQKVQTAAALDINSIDIGT